MVLHGKDDADNKKNLRCRQETARCRVILPTPNNNSSVVIYAGHFAAINIMLYLKSNLTMIVSHKWDCYLGLTLGSKGTELHFPVIFFKKVHVTRVGPTPTPQTNGRTSYRGITTLCRLHSIAR